MKESSIDRDSALELEVEDASGYRGQAARVLAPRSVEELREIVHSAVEKHIRETG